MDLRLRTRHTPGAIVVEVGGEVELHSAPQLREELHRVCEAGNSCIVVDLTGVSFIDSTGLGVLIGGLKRARARGSLSLVCPQHKVRRVFEITGLTNVFKIWNTVDEAISGCPGKAQIEATASEAEATDTADTEMASVTSTPPGELQAAGGTDG